MPEGSADITGNMKIQLTKGYEAIVDDDVGEEITRYRWKAMVGKYGVRAVRTPKTGVILMHRAIMEAVKGQEVDHIDGNSLNNVRSNLRFCTRGQNVANRRISVKRGVSRSKYKGVSRHVGGLWYARIMVNGKLTSLGYHKQEKDAAAAYDVAAAKAWGEFAVLNRPRP